MNIIMKKFPIILVALMALFTFVACVDNDDDVPMNYYQSKKVTAAGFLEENSEQFSEFIAILKRTPYFSMLSTYGTYTLFAPNNDAISRYLQRAGYGNVDNIPTETCDTLARTHIIKKGAFFTTDIGEGALPELNMDDAYIVLSSDSDVTNHNALVYYINKNSKMIDYNDSVTNGVVHVLDNVISSSSLLLPDKIAEDPALTIFSQALSLTGMCDSLVNYIDETYSCSEDSVHEGVMVRCTSGSALYTRSFWPEKRYFKYTAFVEPDSVYKTHGINNLDDLKAYAKRVYDETFPEDAGLYDDDFKNRKNPLNRFVSYHLLPRIGQYNSWVMSGELREHCWYTSLSDPEEFYETMCPGTMMRFAGPPAGLFINRKGLQNRYTVRGVKVLSPSESGSTDQNALNGVYHYLDDILAYTPQVRDVVLNCRIRIDATVLSPDFMNCNGRGRYGEDILTGFKNKYITDWKVSDETYVGVHSDVGYWNSYQANAVCISGVFDVAFKLLPVPSGTYEIRLGYTVGEERGVVQVYLNNEPCGIPVDLRVYGPDPNIGWVEDTDDEEENTANDKAMHNRGYMKGMDSYRPWDADNPLRGNNWNLRRVLATQYLDSNKTYYLRFRQVLDDPDRYWSFDYIELCPKSVYGSPEGEDTH
ncbi:MAG: fasciclin domain-containing protein [Prevotella sp.]|nr:fasciclin domain-containing protein [Prevotella sp.]